MKSCSISCVLLFISIASLKASPIQAQPGKTPGATAPIHQESRQPSAIPAMRSSPAGAARISAAPASSTRPRVIPLGSTLVAELAGSLNVKKLKVGERVKAKLAQDLISGGMLVAKSGSKVLGHVTEVERRTKDNSQSRLGVVFDKILLKKHHELDFEAIVLAVAPPVLRRSRVDEPDQMMPPLTVSPGSGGPGTMGRSSEGRGRSAPTNSDLAGATALNVPITSVQSTPGSNPGDSVGNARTERIHGGSPISAGVGMHGVYGLKDLALAAPGPGSNSGPAIVSTKSDVKLQNGTQIIILVVN